MPKGGNGPRQPLSVKKPGRVDGRTGGRAALSRGRTGAPPGGKSTKAAAKKIPVTPSKTPAKAKRVAGKRSSRAPKDLKAHADAVWRELVELYPDAHCELDFTSPWQLLVATILSAQCTDKRVNMVTPDLFTRWPTPDALATADPSDVENVIRSTGFFRAKTRSIQGAAGALTERHQGNVPNTMPELVVLPGVGRKTANVVLGNAFNINEGVVVDTHVARVGARLGLTSETDPVKIEQDLMALFDRDKWTLLSHLLIWHGRRICDARRPKCEACPLNTICPSSLV